MSEPEEKPADEELADKLFSLARLDMAIHEAIVDENSEGARQFAAIARQQALAALEAALRCTALPPAFRSRFSADAIEHAEQLLHIERGTFSSFFAVNLKPPGQPGKVLTELLAEVRGSIENAPVDETIRTAPRWLPSVVRIASAVLVGVAVGAPLSALAVGEPVVTEIIKTGIALTPCTVIAEVTNHVLERWLAQPPAVEPEPRRHVWTPRDLADDAVLAPGALPEPTDPAHREPDRGKLPEPPERDPADLDEPDEPPSPPPPPPPRPWHRPVDDPFSGFDL